jgi:DNA-binding NarL/FixJ family response regulator
MLKVLLAEDHKILRQGTRLYLESKGINVVGEAATGREVVELVRTLQPELVIMDIHMPELTGIEATRRIRHDYEDIRILVLTAYDEPSYIHALLDAGADGFVLKTAGLSELYAAVQDIAAGRTAFRSETLQKAEQYRQAQADLVEKLSERELEVLSQAAHGLTNKEIGRVLFVSDRKVQGHLQNIYQKLQVATRTEAVTKALSLNLITLNEGDKL